MKQILLLAFILFSIFNVNAQSQCATDEYDAFLKRTNPTYAAERQKMEQQIYSILKNKQNNPNARIGANDCQPSGVFTIPVVVHVIHKGEAIGTGTNISDAQIQNAIQGMNQQWRRITGDGVDMEIQFVLAVRDTNNNSTNGITRHDGRIFPRYVTNGIYSADTTTGANENTVINQTYWDRSKYINIWVADIRGAGGWASLFGNYTFFVHYNSGSSTYSHEMGHTFSLHHTFAGDGSGSGTGNSTQCPVNNDCLLDGDWICDTPPHKKTECSSSTCTSNGTLDNSFKNYMSYCGTRTRFTQGQKDRVKENFYNYYISLIYSTALIPITTPLEVGIVSIENNLDEPICNNFIPKIKIKNSGTTTITNLKIASYVDGALYNTKTISTNLQRNVINTFNLNAIVFNSVGQHNLKFVISEMNGSTTDFQELNNQVCKDILVRTAITSSMCLNFEDSSMNNILRPTNTNFSPQIVNVVGCNTSGSKALGYLSFNGNKNSYKDYFYLPYLKMDSAYLVYLKYNYSYKKGNKYIEYNEDPYVYFEFISACDSSVLSEYTHQLYSAITVEGYDSINPWYPSACNDWSEDIFDLRYKIGSNEDVLIKVNIHADITDKQRPYQNLFFDNFCIKKYYKIDVNSNIDYVGIYDMSFSHNTTEGIGVYLGTDTVTVVAPNKVYYRGRCFVTFKHWELNGQIISTNPSLFININSKNYSLKAIYDTSIYKIDIISVYNPPLSYLPDTIHSDGCASEIFYASSNNLYYGCYEFKNWTINGNIVSTNQNYQFVVSNNTQLVANFERVKRNIILNSNNQYGGTILGGGLYYGGTNITITATPNSCYKFLYWLDNSAHFQQSLSIQVPCLGDATYTAYFEPKYRYNIILTPNPTNGGIVTGAGNFACDSTLTVKAKVKTGYKFTNWTEGSTIVSTDSNYTFLVSGARNLKANFSIITGIKQTTINEISKIYPNPADDILQVEIRSKQNTSLTLNIIDMKGSLLETKTLTNTKGIFNTSFDVSKLSKGNYIINLYDEEGMASYKFVVQ